ncbi:MAG: hypothetical protein ACYDAL_16330 [Candidatus Dormibacteraceae bacterium]
MSGEEVFVAEGYFVLKLSISQRMALVDILIEHHMEPRCSAEFVDIFRDVTTRPLDFLILLDQAKFVPAPRVPKEKAVPA